MALASGLVLSGAALPPAVHAGDQQSQATQPSPEPPQISSGLVKVTDEAPDLNEPCEPGQDKRKSDLCAQWKAADAAREAADWTRRSFWMGLGGLMVGILTLAAAFAAALYAKSAADAANAAVEHDRQLAKPRFEFAGYVSQEIIAPDDAFGRVPTIWARVDVINRGNIEARQFELVELTVDGAGFVSFQPKHLAPATVGETQAIWTIQPNGGSLTISKFDNETLFSDHHLKEGVMAGKEVSLGAKFRFVDTVGKPRTIGIKLIGMFVHHPPGEGRPTPLAMATLKEDLAERRES